MLYRLPESERVCSGICTIRVNYDMGLATIKYEESYSLPYIYKLKKK